MLILRVPGFGKSVNGNTNWISLGFVDVQPSELAKFFLILWAAYMLSRKEETGQYKTNVFLLLAPGYLLIMLLIMMGNDLGTTSVVAAILAGLLFASGVELRILGSLTAVAFVILAALTVLLLIADIFNPISLNF